MIQPTEFYSAYLSNHFKIKSRIAAHFLSLDKAQIDNFCRQIALDVNDIEFLKTVKIDVIQGFYQSVESLFGLMLSLEKIESTTLIPDYLVSQNITELHKYITSFKNFDHCYNYLKTTVDASGKSTPKYQWLFYLITVLATVGENKLIERMYSENNIKGIAFLLNKIAQEFNKEAHNSIKHGLRCVLIEKFNIDFTFPENVDISEVPEELKSFRGEHDVLMYYAKSAKGNKEATIVVVPLDVKYIIYLENAINKLIFNLIDHRQIIFTQQKPQNFTAHFFNYEELEKVEFPVNANFESMRMGAPL